MKTLLSCLPMGLLASALATPLAAQTGSAPARVDPIDVAPVPFGPGEVQRYRVRWGVFGEVGSATLRVGGPDTIGGHTAYHLDFELSGKAKLGFITLASVNDRMQSWLDVSTLVSHRFDQEQHEPGTDRHRILDFFPEQMRWHRADNGETGDLATAEPLDEVSFLYFVRTLPLAAGVTYTFNRYWKDEGNPVIVKVLRRDTLTIGNETYPRSWCSR